MSNGLLEGGCLFSHRRLDYELNAPDQLNVRAASSSKRCMSDQN